jgi:GTPase SAR1 family protein
MVIVVYDATSETSFNSCEKWLRRVRQENPDVHMPGIFILYSC